MDYKLFYWDIPFRGNFPRLLLVEAKKDFQECNPTEIYPHKSLEIDAPGMAPPYLYDFKLDKYINQMPAIMMYLGHKHHLLPKDNYCQALASKITLDCNDVLIEITRYNGEKMWTPRDWEKFRNERFVTWLKIFEGCAIDGIDKSSGFMFEGKISVADISLTALLGTIKHCLPPLGIDIKEHAPNVSRLVDRIEKRDGIKQFLKKQRKESGLIYCSGRIENSIREMIATN